MIDIIIIGGGASGSFLASLLPNSHLFEKTNRLCSKLLLTGNGACNITHDEEIRDFIFSEINFHTSYEPVRCIRTNRYKYIKYYDNNWNKINLSNIDESDPKTFLMKNGLKEQIKYREGLFDLYYDPSERNNLVEDEKYQSILEELREKLYQEQVSRYKSIEDTLKDIIGYTLLMINFKRNEGK